MHTDKYNMNYVLHYEKLITRARDRSCADDYMERHHIIPECFFMHRKRKGPPGWLEGDPNAKENLVLLTPEEHFVAHQFLVKIYINNTSLILALRMMCVSSANQIRNNKEFGWIRRSFCKAISKINTGSGNPMFGKTWDERYGLEESTRRKNIQSKKRAGVIPENKNKTLEEFLGEERANETKALMSVRKKNKSWEEIFGIDEAERKRLQLINRISGKTWEEIHSPDTIKIMREKSIAPKSAETKARMSAARKLFWENKKLNK